MLINPKIQQMCVKKMSLGRQKYGQFKPNECKRNLYDEMIEELIDTINYAQMQIMKLEEAKKKLEKIK